ncbi:MAG: bifunctional glutamate N-acetyltransferase/amino-acid acetyltransferase ArgJ [Hyphomicrobiaceae bacterium]|nr:bifunctional glutamate N-acetyltransferase/amino-acid acetyltransferase ArgJ [Hyphomicrobiaceae bacterium]
MNVSPLAPKSFAKLGPLAGVEIGTAAAGIRYKGREDVMVMRFSEGSQIAGVFTKSSTAGAPVQWCRQHLAQGAVDAIVVNSGNSNVFTGEAGFDFIRKTVAAASASLGVGTEKVFVSSTGVIGELPPADRMQAGVEIAAGGLSADNWEKAARAIMTTDTFPKLATLTRRIGGTDVTFHGIAKGSGMIAPNMATMLVYLATDANVAAPVLQEALSQAVDTTFNAITVDSDTSTSDTLLLAATCQADHARITSRKDEGYDMLAEAVHALCLELAHLVIRDGEGATKFAEVRVSGARDKNEAKKVAMSIANSPLVKTALAGSDPNWGRIMMAIGKTDVPIDQLKLTLAIGGIPVAANGTLVPGYDEAPVAAHMRGDEVRIEVGLGNAEPGSAFTAWTSDLTHGYIDINVDYRS